MNIYLRTISEELIIINVFKFWEISFQHVFREMNQIEDNLSKDGILLGDGEWKKWEFQNDTIRSHLCLNYAPPIANIIYDLWGLFISVVVHE